MAIEPTTAAQNDELSLAGSIHGIFATPVARIQHPAADQFNKSVSDVIMSRINHSSDRFDYKRETLSDMSSWDEPVVDRLTTWVLSCARKTVETVLASELKRLLENNFSSDHHGSTLSIKVGNSWGSVYKSGDQHPAHNHANTSLTAIYYVQGPGYCELELIDPRTGIDYYNPGLVFGGADMSVHLNCSPGELILFPGWLRHAVPPFQGEIERISLSWNLDFVVR